MIEGYQAGVLGGVQSTTPFLNAIGVFYCNGILPRIVLTWYRIRLEQKRSL